MLLVVVMMMRFEIVVIGLQLLLPFLVAAETVVVVADSYNILLADFDIVHLPLMMCHRYIHHPFAVCSHYLIVQYSMQNLHLIVLVAAVAAALLLESARRMECSEEMMRIVFHRMISAVPTDADFFSVVLLMMIPVTCDLEQSQPLA